MQLSDGDDLLNTVLHAPIGICILNAETLFAEIVNQKFLEVAGKPREAIVGQYYWDAFAEVRSNYEEALLKVIETGETYQANEVELRLIRYGCKENIFVTFIYAPVKDDNGRVSKVSVWVLENTSQVSERQAVEATTKNFQWERDRLNQFFMQAPAGICILGGPEMNFEFVNPNYQQLFPGRKLLGKPLLEALPEVHQQPIWEILKNVYRSGQTYEGNELLIPLARTEGGPIENRYFNFTYQARLDEHDQPDGILVFVIEVTGMIGVQQELRRSRDKSEQQRRIYETITAGTPDLMYVFSLDYRFNYANSALLAMWGKNEEDAFGKGLLENGYEPWHAEMHEREIDQIRATKKPVRGEVSFPHATLGRRVYDYILTPVFDDHGEVEAVAGVTRDVSERKNHEQQLQLLINMLPASVVVIRGPELVVEMINQANLDYWNKSAEEVVGKPFLEILPDLADQPFAGQLREVMATGTVVDVRESPVLFENPDGSIRETFVDYSYQPLTDITGERNGVLVMSFEITDRVLARRQVEQSEENLKAMIAQAPVAMCILSGPEHVITVANQLIVELWGKPKAEVMNKPVFEALPDARGQGLEGVMKNVYETGETFYANDLPVSLIRHGKPETVYQKFVYQAYRDAAGRITGLIAITIDVTEQVLARKTIECSEAELREIKSQLEAELEISKQVQRQKDDFIGMASHELKTPLTSLSALLQVASLKLKNSEDGFLSGAMEKSNVQVRRMTAMINGFLNISRLESGKIHIEREVFDMENLINDMIAEAKLTVSTHIIHCVACLPIQVHADREKIGSVISNLISNAVKYSPKGKNIEISCQTQKGEITVSVKDEGMGIKPDDLNKIFDRYYRVETNHTQHIAGFGIGLYLSAEIIQRHNGRIWAESHSGVGSTFYFSLPIN